jgi:glycosyltransferase involved in cell wall biosynthesis
MEISVVIPVYNSAATLRLLMERLISSLDRLGRGYEIIFVDDGSADGSWNVLQELEHSHPGQVVAVQLMRNYGQHNALMCGFRRSRGRYVVTMDDDLQNPPEEIHKLVVAMDTRPLDLIYGWYGSKQHNAFRNLGSTLVNLFYRIVFESRIRITSFRIIRRELLESIFNYTLNFTFVDGLLAWNTQRIGQVLVEHHARTQGRSGYSLRKLTMLAFNLFTNFSLLPLQLTSACGVITATLGFLAALFYLAQYLLSNIAVPGYASTIIALLCLGGLHLLALGIVGEYLGRLHLNVNRKPQYVERQSIGLEERAAMEPAYRKSA